MGRSADEPAGHRVLLIGMTGAGKTTVGRELSAQTGWPFVDNEEVLRRQTGREPAEIRATEGEDVLHVAESDALDEALGLVPPTIIGVAAAAVLDPAAREALREGGHVVWLRARPETLLGRVSPGGGQGDATDLDWLRRRAREHQMLYASVASRIVDVDDRTPAETAGEILRGLVGS
ncbi:MAG: shikimate kinase [Aeromicrobium sp.]